MLKLYFVTLAVFTLSSCAVSISYMGNSFAKTSHVDVYVDAAAIKKNYTVVGKGYIQPAGYPIGDLEKLQERVVQKAKQNGADAVLFQDYYLLQAGTSISTNTRIDTLQKAVVVNSQTYAGPVIESKRQILFLKYD